ncbi:MAG: LuxR C-terminal-related transcriptional regulator [Acidimicrobiales bacterium]
MEGHSRSPLRGREEEIATIRRCLTSVCAGAGGVIVIEGSPGLGKTRLLEECAALANGMSFRIGLGAAESGRSGDELGALFDALFEGHPPLADRRSLSDLHASPEFLFWLLQDVEAIIEESALVSPLLICLDDLHWAGATCAVAMRQLPSRLASLPVAWVMTFRPDQGLHQIQEAKLRLLNSGADLIHLGPVGREAVAEIAADVLGVWPDDELLHKADRVQGNPFLLMEFLRGLQDDRLISVKSGRASLVSDRLPHRLNVSMRRRLAAMSPTCEQVATVACGLGRRFTLHELVAMTEISITDLMSPVRDLLQTNIFAEEDNYLTFDHDLIREAVRGSIPAPVRRALDRQAADVLIARGALPTEVATQLAESAEAGDQAAIGIILEAAQVLSNSDPDGAAGLAAKALDLGPTNALRGPLVACRAVCLFASGRAEEGKRFADSALRNVLAVEEEARVRFGIASMFDISPVVRAESARAGLALPSLPTDLRASLWAALYHSLSVAGPTDELLEVGESAREAAYASTDPASWLRFELPESGVRYQALDFERALDIINVAIRRDHRGHEGARARLSHILRAWILAALDRFDEAVQELDESIAAAQQDHQNWALRVFETTRGRQNLQMGDLEEASVDLEGRFALDEAHLIAGTLHAPAVLALGKLKIHAGDEPGALEVGEIAKVMLQSDAPYVKYHAMWYLALLSLSQGDSMGAHVWLCNEGIEERLSIFPLYPHEVTDDAERIRIAVAVGDAELANHAISLAQRRAEINSNVLSCNAAVAHCRGIWNESVDDLRVASKIYEEGPRPLAHASALEDLGKILSQRGDTAMAVDVLDEALTVTSRVGADWDASRIRARMRRLGVRRQSSQSGKPKAGLGSLTRSEVAVGRLAAEGNTDKQIAEKLFISPHTAHTHLRHIFEKLGINSRVHLSRYFETRALDSSNKPNGTKA